ncbi:sirohydrochlorin chelatase [Bacillus sp. 03113]|uniref:sirohydrochlorin chelatase n=1 Tax=Bacillus sp. 03113 TaxID=2578211 RepID=UPI0015E8B48D|nr:sirohydrochlorin chelatase [Bacillus sp. 03113]
MKAILLVGHGSRDPEGNEQVRHFVNKLKPSLNESLLVETCFLEFEKPTVGQGIDRCVDQGAGDIVVIPIMLLPAGHSKIHIPAAIDEAKKKHPTIRFTYGKPIGIHKETFEILKTRLVEIGENLDNPSSDTAIVLLGRGGSDPDANSDVYKISRLLWEKTKYELVEPAFMGVTAPLVDEGISRCIKLGAKKVIILPYFLFTGILIKRLEKMMTQFKEQHPQVEFQLAEYFGFHPGLQTIIKDRVEEALQGEVHMNCDTCLYRIGAMEHIHHHHHHDHEHDHHHDDHDHHHHHHDPDHEHHVHGHHDHNDDNVEQKAVKVK